MIWRKKRERETTGSSVARAALAGASHEELLQEALKTLTPDESADRIGVWLEPDSNVRRGSEFSSLFRGLVWERAGQGCPPGWLHLSLEPPLPEELLTGTKPVEQHLGNSPKNAVIGQLVGLRYAIWIPVANRRQVRGLILVGSKATPPGGVRERAANVAAELALALELENQQTFTQIRSADLNLARHFLEISPGNCSIETLLANVAADCVPRTGNGGSPGATFAVIGALQDLQGTSGQANKVAFHWRSGDEQWTRTVESEPLASVWRRALEARRVIGSEPPSAWAKSPVARIVAYPLEVHGHLLGTLVAGLPGGATSLVTLDRLELRAVLAASLLQRRKQMEVETQRARGQQELLDLLSEPLLLLDAAGRISASSRGARELLRPALPARESQPADALPSENLSGLFCGRDQERVQRWLHDSLESSTSSPVLGKQPPEAQLHNGINVELHLAPSAPGQLAAILLQPLGAKESARQSDHADAELQNVIEWLEEGVVLFDSHENVRAINTRFEQIMGLAPGQSGTIKSLEKLIARLEGQAAEPGRFAERWRELARGIEGGVREELQMARPAPRILERAARPVLDSIGRQLGRVEIYRDLTAQRVFQSRLLQTEKLASLGQMVSGIAHELSNPLTTILGYAQRLLVRQDATARSEEARQIYQEAERASAILRQLLLNARETLPERRVISLNQIVMRAMELKRFSLAAEKIRVEMDLDTALPPVYGDPGQLQQVLMNLVGNAQYALEQQDQGGTIRLRTRRVGQRRLLLEVEDNGPGIPQAIQARIFDPFFTTKPADVGTGLGLSIVLSVVREHGGQVHVISPPRGGAKFQVELPAASERQHAETSTLTMPETENTRPDPAPFAANTRRGGATFESPEVPRVLVVEDEPTVARLIADVLEDEGMRVDVLLDGREALARAAHESYDLVICDMKMPGLDGRHFLRALQRTGNPLSNRFLFVTGDVISSQTREFLERNHLPNVAKPFRVEELTEKVREVLQMRVQQRRTQTEAARKNAARNG